MDRHRHKIVLESFAPSSPIKIVDDDAGVVMEDVYGERRGEMEVVAARGRWC